MSAVGMYSATARAAEAHTGQHLQGCLACGAAVARAAAPRLGDRVIVDARIMGEVYPVEVIVVQVDVHPRSLQVRIVGRPAGTQVTAFAATSWRKV